MCYNLIRHNQGGDSMKRAYKMELSVTNEQKIMIHQSIGTCRFLYNQFIAHNKELYQTYLEEKEKLTQQGVSTSRQKGLLPPSSMSGYDFDKYVNNELSKKEGFEWIKKCSSKARKQSIMNAHQAFQSFFKGEKGFPNFKKKTDQDVKIYFPKNNPTDWEYERHRIKIPTLGWVKLKEFGYLPKNANIKSGTVSQKADRYFVSVLVEQLEPQKEVQLNEQGLGLDLGLKDFAIVSNGMKFHNINKSRQIKRLEKKLKREQRRLSRKYESLKIRQKEIKKQEGGTVTRCNLNKQILKIQRLHYKLTNLRESYRQDVAVKVAKTKPAYITIEKLNVKGMMKNKHLSKAISQQGFYDFKTKLLNQCQKYGIELREVSMWYPSSKTCHSCGHIHKDLKLKDRIFVCPECGYQEDRDLNASYNLRDATEYTIFT